MDVRPEAYHANTGDTMANIRTIRFAALAAALALPLGIGAVAMAASTQAGAPVATAAAAAAPAAEKADRETADDTADTDNVQEGPGNTADGGSEVPDANEGPEKADAPASSGSR
ncbi:MAG: hypothetical protein NVSMB19_16660 [Vulcanimicrobiaceae bacterium]